MKPGTGRTSREVAATLFIACVLGMPAHAQRPSKPDPIAEYAGEILERSRDEIRRRGENPEDFDIQVLDHLRRGDIQYLEHAGIKDRKDVWAVGLVPKRIETHEIPAGATDVGRDGGDYTFFFRYPSTREFEVWLGE